jgi:uncharacterized protein (TIGR04255 family)
MEFHTYKKAPVVEAVIEVRYSVAISKDDLTGISRRLRHSFPRSEDEVQVGVAFSPGGVNINQSPLGYKLTSSDGLRIVLLRPNGITNSILAPYNGWEQLLSQARTVLAEAKRIIGRREIQRLGVRYINRLDIPSIDFNMRDWVNVDVVLPLNFDGALSEFGARFVVPSSEGLSVILALQTVPSPLIDHSSLMLDIDVSRDAVIENSDDALWPLLEAIRSRKNAIFESCITDRMRAQFDS